MFINKLCHSFETLKLNISTTDLFYDNLMKYIIEYTIQQIKSINKGIDIIDDMSSRGNTSHDSYPSTKQVNMAIEWCNKYDIKVNDKCIYL